MGEQGVRPDKLLGALKNPGIRVAAKGLKDAITKTAEKFAEATENLTEILGPTAEAAQEIMELEAKIGRKSMVYDDAMTEIQRLIKEGKISPAGARELAEKAYFGRKPAVSGTDPKFGEVEFMPMPTDIAAESRKVQELFNMGIITPNEALKMLGVPDGTVEEPSRPTTGLAMGDPTKVRVGVDPAKGVSTTVTGAEVATMLRNFTIPDPGGVRKAFEGVRNRLF